MPVIANLTDTNITVLLPELILVVFAMLVMLIDMFTSERQSDVRALLPWVALVGVLAAVHRCTVIWHDMPLSFQGAAALDSFALGVKLVVLIAAGLSILLSTGYMPSVSKQTGEYYALLLLCSAGMMVMGAATDLITVFLSLEIFSLALYIMCGLNREKPRGIEAAMKYFLLGAFASGFFVYGAALIYGATGSTQYNAIAASLAAGNNDSFLLYPGIALLLVGFGFKVSMVPFHMWTPDVYQGAPTPVTAFMSVGTKTAGFAAFIRLLVFALPAAQPVWGWAVAGFALITMLLGNFAALRQTSLKRMLAYSSIAHAGYILVGLASGVAAAASAAVFYLFAYAFMNIGAFAVVIMLERVGEGDALANRATGLAKRWPYLAAAMAIFMFSLSGLPPLAGFVGKFLVFKAAADGGWITLAILGMLASAVSAYYYLRVV
ncbi:MAG: NADH-quinone oxidoreductase subunit N, partial [Caldilineaceae bacterium]|nr:NADH-quinone oxidoreductase subunit N [Caldilineaceae bacterium]